ncbi:MAG: translocation/assembly module TamB domain-containing protein [Blastocatellales bacterium]
MSASQESLPPRPRRFTRRRLLVYSALGILAFIIIAVLLALLYLRSDRFNRFIAIEIEKALEAYGLRAEIGRFEPGRDLRTVTLSDVKLFNKQTDQLIATIDRATVSLTIRDPFALKLRREIVLDRLGLEGVDLWVVINEHGLTNFQGLRRPPPLARRITFDYSKLVGSLANGVLHIIDHKRGVQSEFHGLSGEAQPIEGNDPPQVAVRLASGAGHLSRDDRRMAIEAVELIGRVMSSGADVERLTLRSPAVEATVSGRLEDWRELRYQFTTLARAELEEVFAFFAPKVPAKGRAIKGWASFDGRIEGEGEQWRASGQLNSSEMTVDGVTFRNALAEKVRVDPRYGKWAFSSERARARSITAGAIELTNASASKLNGTVIDGRAKLTADQATVGNVKSAQGDVNDVTLRGLSATFGSDAGGKPRPGQWIISSEQAQARSIAAGGAEFTNAAASKLSATIVDGRGQITSAQATAERIVAQGAEFTKASASKLSATISDGRGQITSDQVTAERIVAQGTEFTNVSASKLNGTVTAGRAEFTSDQAVVERAEAPQGVFNEITLDDIGATFESGGRWTFSSSRAMARSGVAGGVEFTNASVSNLGGTVAGGRAEITSDQGTVARAVVDGTEFANGSASNLTATIINGRAEITSSQATVERVQAARGEFNAVTLRGVNATLGTGVAKVLGDLSLQGGTWDQTTFGQTTGRLAANRDEISLMGFNSVALGGGATGNLIVRLTPSNPSTLRADFTGLHTAELSTLLGARNDRLVGTVTGRADLIWPGTDLRSASGDISARFDGQTTSAPDAIPVKGEITARARQGVFTFDQFTLRTDDSTLTAAGSLTLSGDSNLRFSLTSTRAEELQTIFDSLGLTSGRIEQLLRTYEPRLFGDFSFAGTITGRLENPAVAGDLRASSFGLGDEILGALTGRVFVSPTEWRFEQGLLTTDEGGTVAINFAAPREATATQGRLDITFARVNIDRLLGALGFPTQQNLVAGNVSGEAHLTGLPAAPRGDVNLNLINGVIAGQPAQSATAVIKFDGQTARIERVEARLPQGRFVASGNVNLQTNEYQLQGQAEQLSLQRLAEAFDLAAARISGVADATFQVSGDFDNAEDFRIELTAQGRQVAVNGRETGPVTLTARTTPDGRVDVELMTEIAGRRQPITASIELRRPGRPAVIRADLVNFDIAPFLAIYAPGVAQTVTGQVTGTLRVRGPLVNSQGEATLAGLRGALSLTAISLQVAGTTVNVSTPLDIAIRDSQIRIDSARITALGTDFTVRGELALTETAPINFSIDGRVNLNVFDRPDDEFVLDGSATVNARIGGTLADPQITGEALLRDISASTLDAPITLDEGGGRIVLSGNRLTLENFTARAGDGVVRISGGATLTQFNPSEWRFDIAANGVDALWREIRATADANLTLTGTPQGQTLSGQITVSQADYTSDFSLADLGEGGRIRFGGIGGTGFTIRPRGALPPVNLDVRLQAIDSFLIRNNQINTVASASLNVTGTLADPDITGRVTLEGGTITFRGHRYDITVGTIDLLGNEPQLQLQAAGDIRGYRVYVGFTGPINSLNVTLRSEPDLPRDQIISLITTGRTNGIAQVGQEPGITGLSTAAALLSEEFISRPIEREAQRILGINRFQIEPVLRPYTNPAARLTIGREIARGLTFIYSTNLATNQDQTGLVEYDFSRNFSILAAYTQSGDIQIQAPDENIFAIEVRGRKYFSLGVPSSTPPTSPGVFGPNLSRRTLPPAAVSVNLRASGPDRIEISSGRMRELIPVIEEGYSRARMRLGERNLANYLQEKGYFFAEVTSRCVPADCKPPAIGKLQVFYDAYPGARYELKDIRIIGAPELNQDDVIASLESKEKSALGGIPLLGSLPLIGGNARGVTSNDRLRDDRETIRERMINIGYRAARVESRLAIDPGDGDLVVIFIVDKGPRSIVEDVVIRGNLLIETPGLRGLAPVRKGDFFSGAKAREGADRIKDFYTSRGFLEARAQVSLDDLPNNRVRLIYDVTEGSRAIAQQIVVSGLTITRQESIRRFFDFEQGQVLTPKPLRNTVRDLYATGAFREVIVRPDPIPGAPPEARRVNVTVTEARPMLMYYGLGYSTDSGPRATLQLTNTNLFGRVISGSTRLLVSQTDQLAQVSLTDLRPWGKKWATTISAFYNRDANLRPFVRRRLIDPDLQSRGQTFGINRLVGFAQAERKLGDLTAVRFRYSYESAKLFNLENIPEIEVTRNERAIRLGLVSAGFTRDTRDSALWPSHGQLFSADHSLAAHQLGGNESYNKFFGAYQRYDTLPRLGGLIFGMSARVGLATLFAVTDRDENGIITEPERRLPISERFFAGGATTLRGFRFEQAGPQGILEPRNPNELPTLVPLGGDALMIFNFELHFPLTQRVRLVPFYDWGNVFRKVSDINFAGMTNSVGLGLRFNTPIGPIGVDYGFLLDPPSFVTASGAVLRQPRSAFHFRIGQTF